MIATSALNFGHHKPCSPNFHRGVAMSLFAIEYHACLHKHGSNVLCLDCFFTLYLIIIVLSGFFVNDLDQEYNTLA